MFSSSETHQGRDWTRSFRDMLSGRLRSTKANCQPGRTEPSMREMYSKEVFWRSIPSNRLDDFTKELLDQAFKEIGAMTLPLPHARHLEDMRAASARVDAADSVDDYRCAL